MPDGSDMHFEPLGALDDEAAAYHLTAILIPEILNVVRILASRNKSIMGNKHCCLRYPIVGDLEWLTGGDNISSKLLGAFDRRDVKHFSQTVDTRVTSQFGVAPTCGAVKSQLREQIIPDAERASEGQSKVAMLTDTSSSNDVEYLAGIFRAAGTGPSPCQESTAPQATSIVARTAGYAGSDLSI